MLIRRNIPKLLICLSVLLSAICAHGDEEIEDLIDIFESNDKIVGIIDGKKTESIDLRGYEEVLWHGSDGHLGAFLTNKRFFVLSSTSNAWHVMDLRSDESEQATAYISPYLALLVTGDRAIGFDAASGRFVQVNLPIHDTLIDAGAGKNVAVVITSGRAFGLATGRSAFSETDIRIRETVKGMKITSNKAIVRTSDRLLIFSAKGAGWREENYH
ncbi:MAG: hypothetical protein GY737_24200 [Desulfobacteraceae bacterium]|nr:hypothetical protein [Desulfobacteraceae bacterium]